jgi:polysaccharide pyruvyl transferase WcaK-like protein
MRIGILTYHRVVNDGSILQAYCLQNLLSELIPSAKIEVIDYRPRVLERLEYRRIVSRRFPFVQLSQLRRMWDLRSFVRKNMDVSRESCTTDSTSEAAAFISGQEYDVIVVGSDTVWEIREKGNVPPAPNIFFLPGVNTSRKLSFAASSDPVVDTPLLKQEPRCRRIRELLDEFALITIRDDATFELLSSLGVDEDRLRFMPDPTLLWDFTGLVDTTSAARLRGDKPLAGLATSELELRRQVSEQLVDEGFEVINLLGEPVGAQKRIPAGYGLEQRLGIYKHLDLMITDRFHGSIFSLKVGQVPVVFIERGRKWPHSNSKGRDLFRRLGLEDVVWRYNGGSIPDDFVATRRAISEEACTDVGTRLTRLADQGREVLTDLCEEMRHPDPGKRPVSTK